MTPIEAYKRLLAECFGHPVRINSTVDSNNCIGALASDQFEPFRDNFRSRLRRLVDYYTTDPTQLRQIEVTAAEIAYREGYKWSGPYSDLVALDFWIQFDSVGKVRYCNNAPSSEWGGTLAHRMGKQTVDIDLTFSIGRLRVFADVKSFVATYFELIDKVKDEIRREPAFSRNLVELDDYYGVPYEEATGDLLEAVRSGRLRDGIVDSMGKRQSRFVLAVSSGRTYNFSIGYPDARGGASLAAVRIVEPYQMAENYRYKFLEYGNKLVLHHPSLVISVVNPWFNREIIDFQNINSVFYRSVARRVFFEFQRDQRKVSEVAGLEGDVTVSEVSTLITGIVFLEDRSIERHDKPYDCHVFLNPNAVNGRLKYRDLTICFNSDDRTNIVNIDDFAHDAY